MDPPKDVSQVRAYLGMTNQLKHFYPKLTCNLYHIRTLFHKGVEFKWTEEMQKEFQTIKDIISSPVYLKQFDINKKTQIYTDASKLHGCAYILTQPTGEFNDNGKEK